MAHHSGSGGAGGGAGIESITARTGLFTALMSLGVFFSGVWLIAKDPILALKCVAAGAVFAVCGANINNPLFGLAAIATGCVLAGGSRK